MFLSIRHTTTYSYDKPVILEPHTIRLTPRADAYRRLVERSLTCIPEPDGTTKNLDYNGAVSHVVWFKRPTTALTVISASVMELHDMNPFDYLIYPISCLALPMVYPQQMRSLLDPFILKESVNARVNDYAQGMLEESKHNVLDFTTMLCRKISQECVYEARYDGEPLAPERVLLIKRGSCRDLTMLYIAAARSVGLAARFVSGYYFDQSPKNPQMHAWAEVYIPGGGWRGFDPTLGLACYGHHIPLAAGALSSQAAAVEGSFLGSPDSKMEVSIEYDYLKHASFNSTS